MKSKILLIDGNSIINRAFYALPVLTNGKGEFTNAVYGFLNIFFKFLDEEQPAYAAVAFDVHAPTFRHGIYAPYKGTRKPMPEELRPQLPLLKNLLALMEVQTYEMEGFEADDVLGTLARQAEAAGLAPIVVTGDRDLLQTATDAIKIRIPKTKRGNTEVEDYFAQGVLEKIGVTPAQYVDVKALMGDPSDNIPGAPGIGEKTAVKLIQEYETLENCLARAGEVKPARVSACLLENKDLILLSKRLAAINSEAPVKLDVEGASLGNMYNGAAMAELQRLGCNSVLPRFAPSQAQTGKNAGGGSIAASEAEAASFVAGLKNLGQPSAFQLITSDYGLSGVGFAYNDGGTARSMFIPASGPLTPEKLLALCAEYFASGAAKLTHDAKSAMSFLNKARVPLNNVVFDTMLAAYVLDASKPSYDVSAASAEFLNEPGAPAEAFWGKGKSKRTPLLISAEEMARFACAQAEAVLKLYPVLSGKLAENGQADLFEQIEMPLAETLSGMELAGIKVNPGELAKFGAELQECLDQLTGEIYALSGETFNINSPAQMSVVLFEKLGLKGGKKTKQGYSTAAGILEKLKPCHPIIGKILEYRTYAKLKSTYADGLLGAIDPATSKIYSTFSQTVASTGRISSSEPNLQNIPIRIELGRRLRKAFVPSGGDFIFLDADYSQIELRVLAHLAGDAALIGAFNEGQDIHRLTASQAFKIPFGEVTPEQRSAAKAVNFGIVYGISAFSLSEDLGITKKEAENYISGYFQKYPKVKEYMENAVKGAREAGHASTIFGRRRRIPELNASNFNDRSFGERAAMNMPVQGTAADIIKIAMIRVSKRLKAENRESRLILQVHDELLLEAKRGELEAVSAMLKEEMENAVSLSVPMRVDIHTGETWYDAK